jgi:hypothetical protein
LFSHCHPTTISSHNNQKVLLKNLITIQKSPIVTHNSTRVQEKTAVLSIDAEKAFDKIQHLFMIFKKSHSQQQTESNFFNLMRNIYKTL